MFFLVADLHALSTGKSGDLVELGTLEVVSTYLALGLDPAKVVIYRQSDVLTCPYLAWLLASRTPAGLLTRNPSFRAAKRTSAGLLSYPLLMASDILGVRATVVPVGRDQRINVETARVVARRFNSRYGTDLFPVPETRLTQRFTVPGIDGKKMRNGTGNSIKLFGRFDVLQDRVARIQTDSRGNREPKDPSTCTVFKYYSMVAAKDDTDRMRARYLEGSIGYEEAKRELTRAIFERFGRVQGLYGYWKRHKDAVLDILEDGTSTAAKEFAETLDAVFSILRLRDRIPAAGWEG